MGLTNHTQPIRILRYIMPLVINALGADTHADRHTYILTRGQKRFQETNCTRTLTVCAWLKNVIIHTYVMYLYL